MFTHTYVYIDWTNFHVGPLDKSLCSAMPIFFSALNGKSKMELVYSGFYCLTFLLFLLFNTLFLRKKCLIFSCSSFFRFKNLNLLLVLQQHVNLLILFVQNKNGFCSASNKTEKLITNLYNH